MSTTLTLDSFDAPARRLNIALPVAPPAGGWTWPPTSVTLIEGEQDAVLIDTLPTMQDASALADWIAAKGKKLSHIFITHGHIDHYLGTYPLLERFPGVQVVSTAATAAFIAEEERSRRDRNTWSLTFADPLVGEVVVPDALPTDGDFSLEGHALIGMAAGHSDMADSSFLWVPDLAAAVVGDIAYNGVHVPLFETDPNTRAEWITALRALQHRDPRVVVASHRAAGAPNDAQALAHTIEYLQYGDTLLNAVPRPSLERFVAQMVAANPTRENVTTLIYSAITQGLQ
jgi:glyoxylase-like metal-dependent hydrolase (beta-lactamase superfamily II)